MPTFDLTGFSSIDAPPITLDTTSDSIAVDVRFTDGALWMPDDQRIQVTAQFTQPSGGPRLRLLGTFDPPVALAGGQLLLDDVTVSIPFDGAVVDTDRPVIASGTARWVLPSIASGLGISEIGFDLGASTTDDTTRLELTLADPISLPQMFIEITNGSLVVSVVPSENAFEVALTGVGGLTNDGRSQVQSLLAPVFGAGDPLADVPSAFTFRRRFHLAAGSIPDVGLPAGPAMLRLFPDWEGGAPPDLTIDLPEGLGLDIGLPELSLDLDDGDSGPGDIGVRLTDCGLHFPQIGGLPPFDLSGVLEVVTSGTDTVLRLRPTVPGGVELPGVVRWFLSRLRWLADAADLDGIVDQFVMSMEELEWEQLFRGLLTATGGVPSGFADAFETLLGQAIAALTPATPVDRVLLIAFTAFEDVADDVFGVIWEAVRALDVAGELPDGLAATVVDVLRQLGDVPALVEPALRQLVATLSVDEFEAVLARLLAVGADLVDDAADYLTLLMRALAVAIDELDADDLARIIMDLLVANDDADTNVSLPDLLGAPSLFDHPDLQLPAIPALLMSALGGLIAGIPGFVPRLPTTDSLYEVVRSIAGAIGEGLAAVGISQLFDLPKMTALLEAIIDYSADDLEREKMLLRTSRIPVLGIAVTIMAVIRGALTNPLPWWELMGADIVNDDRFVTRQLPAPGTPDPGNQDRPRKYLIVSDVHRDKEADDVGFLNVGSIDHFTRNRALYQRILDWVDEEGYTMIEGGDGEELWYVRNFEVYHGPRAELEQIISLHTDVYERLSDLHSRGRYFRVKGNHDSYLDIEDVRAPLDTAMTQVDATKPFVLDDFIVIPGVKTLQDAWWGGMGGVADLLTGDADLDDYLEGSIERLLDLGLGLDSTKYSETKPMVVAHGHQWDFWNCRGNELIGKMLSNMVGVPLDQILDPFIDARGFAFGGEPTINLGNIAAEIPVLDGWLGPRQAQRFAHQIQHQSSADRLLIDDVMFTETVAALTAGLGIVVPQPTEDGSTPVIGDIQHWISQRFNQLCLGHTHFPQSQPFWDLESLLAPLGIGERIRDITRTFLFGWEPSLNLLRALYYNTGTAGWLEGVIWAIEISEQGHARLVFWTENSIGPETMDWELSEMPAQLREQLDDRVETIRAQVAATLQTFGEAALGAAAAAVSVSLPVIVGVVAQATGGRELDVRELLDDASEAVEGALEGPGAVISQVQAFVVELLVATFANQQGVGEERTFTLRVPIPPGVEDALAGVSDLLSQLPEVDPSQIPRLACGWLQLVRNLPFFGGFESRRNVAGIDDRVFWVVVSLLFQLPTGDLVNDAIPLATAAEFDGDDLVLTATVG